MSQNLTISETGLKLIKAFEGYRPVDRELISGQRIVGYGHRLYSEDAVMMNKGQAETTLRSDLEPFEDMINSEVHAPISQSQFDALCSFAFNIGPKAFLKSDTLRALNNGRPLDAANGLDIWRKSEIAGKTYVVDALMRRRTAEKALFLRTERGLPAGREDLPPVKDTTITGLSTEDALPVFIENDANGIVATPPYEAFVPPSRRRDDGPAGALQLSELDIIEGEIPDEPSVQLEGPKLLTPESSFELDDLDLETLDIQPVDVASDISAADNFSNTDAFDDETDPFVPDADTRQSPIAAAATDIVARLDALIEDADARFEDPDTEWPESLISAEISEDEDRGDLAITKLENDMVADTTTEANVIDLNTRSPRMADQAAESSNQIHDVEALTSDRKTKTAKPVVVIDELAQDDAFRMRTDSAAKYIETTPPMQAAPTPQQPNSLGLWIPVILGFLLVGLAGGALAKGAEVLLGEWGPIIAFMGFVIGLGLILAGVYAWLRMNLRS